MARSVCVRRLSRTSREAAIARAGHLPFGRPGASPIAAVRLSCAFRAAPPASGTPSRRGQCVRGGEQACNGRRLSRVRDIKFLEGGTIRASRRPRCHGAAQAWQARSEGPDASAGVVRGVCAPWWRHHQLRRARKVLARPWPSKSTEPLWTVSLRKKCPRRTRP